MSSKLFAADAPLHSPEVVDWAMYFDLLTDRGFQATTCKRRKLRAASAVLAALKLGAGLWCCHAEPYRGGTIVYPWDDLDRLSGVVAADDVIWVKQQWIDAGLLNWFLPADEIPTWSGSPWSHSSPEMREWFAGLGEGDLARVRRAFFTTLAADRMPVRWRG